MIQIIAIHMEGGERHEHIAELSWLNPETAATGATSRANMVNFIRGNGKAFVKSENRKSLVGWVDASPPYVRTYADGVWNNNLLALPKY